MDRLIDGGNYGWTNILFCTDAINACDNNFPTDFAIFTKKLRTDGPKDGSKEIHSASKIGSYSAFLRQVSTILIIETPQ